MAIYKVVNESTAPEPEDALNESGGAHQKLAKLKANKLNKIYKNTSDLGKLSSNHSGKSDEAIKNALEKNKKDYEKITGEKGFDDISNTYTYTRYSKKYGNPESDPLYQKFEKDKDRLKKVHNLKKRLGVGEKFGSKEEGKTPGLYKKLQDIKRNEAFDMCADYVVGCLEGSVDEFDLDLFTEASAFIIDCLDEDDE